MPSKKKRYNARFPAGRIKKIMQTDEEVGKVAQAVPVIISRTLELFVESLLTKAMEVTNAKNAKTLSPSHMKQCILSESRFDFLKDLVKSLPDVAICDMEDGVMHTNSSSQPSTPTSNKPETTRGQQGSGIFSPYIKPEEGVSCPPESTNRGQLGSRICSLHKKQEEGVSCPPGSTNRITPNFYTENPELAGMSYCHQQAAPKLQSGTTCGGPVNHSESEDDLEEPAVTMPYFTRPSVSIDEDYDT